METTRKYFMPGKVGWYFLIIFFTLNSGYVFYRNMGVPTNKELREYEDRLGEACIKYAKLYNTNTVYVPEVKTSLPAFPFLRDLIFICRYSTPYAAHLHFKLSSDDNRLIEILNSDRKYDLIRSRLTTQHLDAQSNRSINNCTANCGPISNYICQSLALMVNSARLIFNILEARVLSVISTGCAELVQNNLLLPPSGCLIPWINRFKILPLRS
jgi:hypothetical protein